MVTWILLELDEVDSTQTIARDLAEMGAPEGTTVVAKSQKSGKGRLGRAWFSPIGGLYTSFILRPENLPRPELATLVSALAIVRGVRQTTGLTPTIRWPNDIMLVGKKLAGVIAEAKSYKQRVNQIIVGMGVNCNASLSGAKSLREEAISLSDVLGRHVEISELTRDILDSFSKDYSRWKAGTDMVSAWRKHVATLGKPVSIKLKTDETPFSCIAVDVSLDGSLIVRKGEKSATIHPEDLEWLREKA